MVLQLSSVRATAVLLLTSKAALGVFDAVTLLKLQKAGVQREFIGYLAPLLLACGLGAQLFVSARYFTSQADGGAQPLLIWRACWPARLLLGGCSLAVVHLAFAYADTPDGRPSWIYALITCLAAVGQVVGGGK